MTLKRLGFRGNLKSGRLFRLFRSGSTRTRGRPAIDPGPASVAADEGQCRDHDSDSEPEVGVAGWRESREWERELDQGGRGLGRDEGSKSRIESRISLIEAGKGWSGGFKGIIKALLPDEELTARKAH